MRIWRSQFALRAFLNLFIDELAKTEDKNNTVKIVYSSGG